MSSKYSIKSFIVFWGLVFCATALFFSIVVTQIFFNSYILNSSFKELKTLSESLSRFVDSEIDTFESLQSEKLQSEYFLKAILNKEFLSLDKLFTNWKEAHKLKDIFLYDAGGTLIDLRKEKISEDGVSLSSSQINFLKKGDLNSVCEISSKGILIDVSRQIRNELGEPLGFFSQRKELSFKKLIEAVDENILVASNNKRVFFNSMKLSKNESLKVSSAFISKKMGQFVLTLNGEKYDFIRVKSCEEFNLFVGKKNLQQEIYFNFYKKFFPFLVLFLFLTAALFSVSFYRQILKPLKELNEKITSKESINIETNISEIESISSIVSKEISGLEEKVQETHEGRKRDINRLVASVAHELNNSLSYLGGNLEYLTHELSEETPDKEEAIEAIKSANLGFSEIKKIVSDLKVFSNSGSISRNEFEIVKIKRRILEKYNQVTFKGFDTKGLIVVSDFERVMQILVNLIQNAKSASVDGKAQVTLTVRAEAPTLKIIVEDDAGGINPSIKDKIFEPFFTTKKTEGGTGLGLALSRNLARSLDGDLVLDKTDEQGSQFCLILRNSI